MPTLGAIAQTNEPYVVLKDGTATFYYNSSKSTGALPLQSDWDDSNWPNDTRNSVTKVVFDASFKDCKPTSCAYWFYQFKNLIEISGIKENLNTANVTNMGYMFHGCSSLTTLDLSNFNTANVTNMGYMFRGCSSLTTLDVSNFNTANVTTMDAMFHGCSRLTTLDVSNFNTANVKNMEVMFFDCSSLTTLDLSNFNTANVTNMGYMFRGCSRLTTLDVSNFNTANVKNMEVMFFDCSRLTTLDVSNFNTANVTDMHAMFRGCSRLTTLDVSNFNTANVTDMDGMFYYCSSLTTLDVSNFNTANVTDMHTMFSECSSLTTLDVSNFNTANVTAMCYMFENCSSLTTLDVSNFNTANVKNMSSMFSWCTSLTTIDVSNFNTANVTTMVDMFFCCSSLNAIFVGDDWSTASVTESSCMFFNCTKLFGGKGTRCTGADSHIDATYAKIDGGESDPGYLTKSGEPIFKGIISIEISTMPKTDYKVGEDFEIADGTLTLTYNNGETENINLSNAKITGFDKTKIGEQTLKVEYQGVETTLTTPVSFIPDTQTDVIVWSFNSTIYLETLPDTKYTIIDLNGRTIKSATTKSSHEEISITKSGVYIVLVNGESYKVSIN